MGKKPFKFLLLFSGLLLLTFSVGYFGYEFQKTASEQSATSPFNPIDYNLPSTAKEVVEKRTNSTVTFELSPGKYAAVSRVDLGQKQEVCISLACTIVSWIKNFFSPEVLADTAGPNFAGTGVEDTSTGTLTVNNPGNGTISDSNYATVQLTGN